VSATQFFMTFLASALCAGVATAGGHARRQVFSITSIAIATLGVTSLIGVLLVTMAPDALRPMARIIVRAATAGSVVTAGVAMGVAVVLRVSRRGTNVHALVVGLGIHVAAMFAGFEVGKLAHDPEMRAFFLQSGYPIGFMYLVMGVEIVGATGLLVTRLRACAAWTLLFVLLGAVGTHVRNGDPLDDSLDAIRMLFLVAAMLLLARSMPSIRKRAS
jgi:hypothetical protein